MRRDRPYYYRSVRQGRKVRSIYVGGGELGRLAAEADALRRASRHAEQVARAAEIEHLRSQGSEAIEDTLDGLVAGARKDAAAVLEAAGYHQHNRGEWRKRRRSGGRERDTGPGSG